MRQYFAVFATDNPEMREVRERTRFIHRAYLQEGSSQGVFVRLGGPTLAAYGESMNGTLLVIEADCIEDAQSFIEGDPYVQAGLFERIEVRQWDWSLGNPERRI